ncbi:MAG: hypothetical protein ABSA83_18550 [Verrucomicrobiota bacterium]
MSRAVIRFWVYALPLPLFVVMYFVWAAWSDNRIFALYVMLLPVFYGYVAPGIATNLLHKWRFKGPWVVGSYYAHHGFMYSANMSPLLFIALLGTPHESLSTATVLRVLLCTGALYGFTAWMHDILMVRHGMVEIYSRPAAQGRSPEEIVTHYAPLCFFLLGLTYAAGALLAFQTFVVHHKTDAASIVWVSLAGVILMFSLPSLAYRASEGNKG